MKKVKTSAEVGRCYRIQVEISEANHAALIELANALGLTPNQGFGLLLNWAKSQGTLLPPADSWRAA